MHIISQLFFFLMIRRPPRSTQSRSSAASDVYKRQLVVRAQDNDSAPKTLCLFVNKNGMSFEDCENDEPTQTLELSKKDFAGQSDLRFVKFQSVKSITVFIKDNNGADNTNLVQLSFWGNTLQDTNMKNLKKISDESQSMLSPTKHWNISFFLRIIYGIIHMLMQNIFKKFHLLLAGAIFSLVPKTRDCKQIRPQNISIYYDQI
eukprot:TRINITY_DN6956_c0_g1_i9.p1 TRINITY_DN6956_c0_g1~~TRINITY_DN6956_c0_g1_i9.p1  ORF type:complete len:204 (-),score=51.02 TRINITY_DN6956_c0_g1_i9:26-637(-)